MHALTQKTGLVALLATSLQGAVPIPGDQLDISGFEKYAYKSFTNRSNQEQNLYVYACKPDGWKTSDARSAIIFIHGGGYINGDPTEDTQYCRHFSGRGMVTFTIEETARFADIGRLVASLAGRLGVAGGGAVSLPAMPVTDLSATAPAAVAAPAAAPAAASPAAVTGPTINAPLNGTFYRSAAPGKPNLAEEGTAVKAGDAVCIVEAMKLFNQIKADKACKIVKFLVNHGDHVAKGQPMASIELLS